MPGRSNWQPAPAEDGKRRRALLSGRRAEAAAALFLRLKGYRILARRYCVNGGEIDLIAQRFDSIVFVEVKIRPTLIEAMTTTDAESGDVCRAPFAFGSLPTLGRHA